MVDIHSVVASSHPSRRERESKWETNSRSRARRSRWAGGRTDGTTVMLERQPQRTASTTASPSAVAGIDDALLAVRQLLNNSPPSEASPSAAEQRRHDIDQLIIAAINTPHQERRCQPSAQQSRVLPATRTPSVATSTPSAANCAPTGATSRTDGKLYDDAPQGGNQPPSWWGRQSHHHRAPP
jgi:hypothetical protein